MNNAFIKELSRTAGLLTVEYASGEIILPHSEKISEEFGIVLEGTVYKETIDENGIRRILAFFSENEMFPLSSPSVTEGSEIFLITKTRCRILHLSVDELMKVHPGKNINELLGAYYYEAQQRQLAHINMLQQHTLRQKVLTFLKYTSLKSGKTLIHLPIPLTDVADYLSVDRSAMMREIKRMADDGLIRRKGRLIKLL